MKPPPPSGHLRLAASAQGPRPGAGAASDRFDSGAVRAANARRLDLRVLATSDLHGQILSYDYFANRPLFGTGLAQTAALIAAARAEAPNSILLDNGDFLQGSALTEMAAAADRRRGRPHPAITAFNVLNYDAVALGNHEFDYGLDRLAKALAEARFAVVSATVLLRPGPEPTADRTLVPPYVILTRHMRDRDGTEAEVRIGVLGLTPPEILDWSGDLLAGQVWVRPMVAAARAWVPQMRAEGADVVVCLAHAGIARPGFASASDEVAIEIAQIGGIDALVAGHTHLVFPPNPALMAMPGADPRIDSLAGRICGTPTVQPGHSGSHLGVIELELTATATGWTVTGGSGRTVSASEVVAGLSAPAIRRFAAPLRAAIASDHRAALAWTRRRLGQTTMPLSTYFATVADSQAMRLLAAAKEAAVRRALQGLPEAALPVIATVTPFRGGGRGGPLNYTDIRPGALSVRHVHDLYPFPNTLRAVRTTAAELRSRLERSAGLFLTLRPGLADQPLIDAAFPPFNFELAPAVSFRIDLSRPPGLGERIRDLALDGRPLDRDTPLVLATNSHRLGGHRWAGVEIPLPRQLCTQAIAAYVADHAEIGPQPGAVWSLAPLPGASVIFDSGAGALDHLAEVADLRPELLGLTDQGFHRFRLHL
ncbi:5'-nucleotidase C-terminal domain-containing protein [Rhodobacter sp. Har01]|nr:5'-nucleotidase C-terminal domain-containing protein [Rhodobacter sp. Har01]